MLGQERLSKRGCAYFTGKSSTYFHFDDSHLRLFLYSFREALELTDDVGLCLHHNKIGREGGKGLKPGIIE